MFVLIDPMASGCDAVAPGAEHGAERLHLDRVAQRGAGAVRLDVADLRRRDTGRRERPRITASCAGPLGAVSPPLRPS